MKSNSEKPMLYAILSWVALVIVGALVCLLVDCVYHRPTNKQAEPEVVQQEEVAPTAIVEETREAVEDDGYYQPTEEEIIEAEADIDEYEE